MADITLYHSPASRAFTTYWLLEELGTPFKVKTIDLSKGEQKSAEYRRINPMGKVPALTDGKVTVTENPAICLYLADRYGYGRLAPKIEAAERGAYLRWMVFSTAVLEPAANLKSVEAHKPGFGAGWGELSTVIETVRGRGESFSTRSCTESRRSLVSTSIVLARSSIGASCLLRAKLNHVTSETTTTSGSWPPARAALNFCATSS